jgi:hypothetical protein
LNEIAPNLSGFPTRQYKFDSLRLTIGHRLQIELPTQNEPVPARLLGYLKGETLIVRLAATASLGNHPLGEDDALTVRGFSGRIAFSFQTTIEKIRYVPYTYCHLKFPEGVQGTEIRHAERVRVNLPVKVVSTPGPEGQVVEATIANLSSAGAMLLSAEELGVVGDRLALTFRFWVMPNDYEVNMNVSAVIQTVTSPDQAGVEGLHYGVKFDAIRSTESILLQNLIYQRLQESPDASV